MCSRGVHQLKKVSLFFCDWGGSSQGARNILKSQTLQQFAKNNPHIQFQYIRKRNAHPYISSLYINGYIKDVPLRNMTQKEIMDHLNLCNTSFGRKALSASGKRVFGAKESFQGKWYPNMWANFPRAQMEKIHVVQEPFIPMKPRRIKQTRPTKAPDAVSTTRSKGQSNGGQTQI